MSRLTHASTFSGIGGPEVAASMLGWENLFHCEIQEFPSEVLKYWYPNAKHYTDITKTDFSEWRGKIDVLTGGFPCQPFSYAGKRRGSEDDRYLWPYMLKCIEQVRPSWFVGENVGGISTMALPGEDVKMATQTDLFGQTDYMERVEKYVLSEICLQLENIGYTVQPCLIPACAVGAPHRRDRIFIIAEDTYGERRRIREMQESGQTRLNGHTFPTGCNGKTERPDTDTMRDGLQYDSDGKAEEEEDVRPQSRGRQDGLSEQPHTVETACSGRNATDTDNSRLEGENESWTGETGRPSLRRTTSGLCGPDSEGATTPDTYSDRGREIQQHLEPRQPDGKVAEFDGRQRNVTDTKSNGYKTSNDRERGTEQLSGGRTPNGPSLCGLSSTERWRNFPTQSPVLRGNDGISVSMDNLTIPFARWRKETLKAYGNAIVPQVIYEIFRAIDIIENEQ